MSIFNNKNRYISIEAYYSISFDSFKMRKHKHNSCEIMYVTKGSCHIEIGTSPITLRQGQFIFIDQNIPHSLCVLENSPCSIINLEFCCRPDKTNIDISELAAEFSTFSVFLQNPFDYTVLYDNGTLCHTLKDLLLELENNSFNDSFVLKILIMHILIELSRCAQNNISTAGLSYVHRAQQYIKDNLDNEFNIQTIASHVGIHKAYLQKLFRQYQNCSISEYRNKLKLQKAAYLLKNTNLGIIEIAFEAGYNSRQHFSYTFEKYYKISPKEYRQKNNIYKDIDTKGIKLLHDYDNSMYISLDKDL